MLRLRPRGRTVPGKALKHGMRLLPRGKSFHRGARLSLSAADRAIVARNKDIVAKGTT